MKYFWFSEYQFLKGLKRKKEKKKCLKRLYDAVILSIVHRPCSKIRAPSIITSLHDERAKRITIGTSLYFTVL